MESSGKDLGEKERGKKSRVKRPGSVDTGGETPLPLL